MIHRMPLEHLPEQLVIPDKYRERFRYDEQRHCLVFDGPMFKSTFDRLSELSQSFDYQRSLEDLFRLAVPEDPSRPSHSKAVALAIGIGVLCVAAAVLGGILILN